MYIDLGSLIELFNESSLFLNKIMGFWHISFVVFQLLQRVCFLNAFRNVILVTNHGELNFYLYQMLKRGKLAASNFFMRRFIELDLISNCYKTIVYFFSLIPFVSNCKKIPKPEYILVFKTLYINCEGCTAEEFDSNELPFIQVSIVHYKNRRLIVHETRNHTEAFAFANDLASYFGLRIRDAATNRRSPVWIKTKEVL